MDRFRMLEAFEKVAELGSFTRAAERLALPRATVTELVQALEARVGTTLLHRTTRRVSLTPEGADFLERTSRILEDLEDAEDALSGARKSVRGRLRVDVSAASGRHVLAPRLPELFALHPELEIELGSSDRPVDLVGEGVDCVIRGGDVHDDTLVARKLATYESITCASPAYLRAHGVPRSPADLGGHVFVNFFSAKTGRVFDNDFVRGDETVSLRGRHRVAANDADTYVALAVAGLGLVQVPWTKHTQSLLETKQLVRVLADWHVPELPVHALWPKRRDRSARIHAFVSWAADIYAEEAGPHGATRKRTKRRA